MVRQRKHIVAARLTHREGAKFEQQTASIYRVAEWSNERATSLRVLTTWQSSKRQMIESFKSRPIIDNGRRRRRPPRRRHRKRTCRSLTLSLCSCHERKSRADRLCRGAAARQQ